MHGCCSEMISLPLLLQNSLISCIQNRDDIISASP
jgi:hypothetical protein